ncbi:stage II sporulation protein R [Gottschalkia purinilytica]|uniref:Stage II sporulation protein R n=1 Tax=Gottschalkia purinilytica TaxID=1503 RepID=A0A0L0WE70_GOTPU|nr:stage II sporulation protein R [Gottschalkia purinilytica]KNF09777.1 stage II sporulation protein R [Gottschalkia purinilytica]
MSIKNKKGFFITIMFSLVIISIGIIASKKYYKTSETYKDKLIRFHVLANSDLPEDQELKLKVRDKVLNEISHKFINSKSIEETRKIIKQNMNEIRDIALKEIKESGKDYDVDIKLGKHTFPTKSYGNFTLPAGEYESVRIIIGEGNGQNWWCVMFPPLCFVDAKNGLTDKKTENRLKEVLTEDEYGIVSSTYEESPQDQPIKLKSKIAEVFEKIFVTKNETDEMKEIMK